MQPHRWQPIRLPCPWDSPGKNTGVGCHFLLQCMKVKSESEVAQSCSTLSDPMDCSLPGSSTQGIFQARVLEWGAIAFSVMRLRFFFFFFNLLFLNLFFSVCSLFLKCFKIYLFFNWRTIALQNFIFCQTSTWISHRYTYESESEVAQSFRTLCGPMDYSLPGSFIHGIFQARVLEWGAIAFSERDTERRPFWFL